jgi:hypothetical protein
MLNAGGHSKWKADQPADVAEIHRWFHYVVCKWLQDQGCNVVR